MIKLRNIVTTLALGTGVLLVGGTIAQASETSVVDYLYQKGEDHTFNSRSQLASEYGISNYTGTAQQNVNLLTLLKGDNGEVSPREEREAINNVQNTSPNTQPKPEVKQKPQGKTMTMVATAYTASPDENGTYGGRVLTATGFDLTANPNAKVIAVDPNVIPLGSKVWVEGYGEAMALDTGRLIKNNKIDLLMPNKKVSSDWGRRTVQVTILD
ncbi:endolysin [Bacillus phage vB_BceH_LY2]|nr:endolysin [Bacillus phage vB_BceH_LY2]